MSLVWVEMSHGGMRRQTCVHDACFPCVKYLRSSMPHAHEDPGRRRRHEIHQLGWVATGRPQFPAANTSKGEGQACDFQWGWQGGLFTSLCIFPRMTSLTDNRSMASSSLW